MNSLLVRGVTLLTGLCLAGSIVVAQVGGMRVRVVDRAGNPLPGATVVLSNEGNRVPQTAIVTDGEGWAVFPVLVAGPGYAVDVSLPGHARQRMTGLRVRSEESPTLSIQLGEELEERVRVTADRGLIELEETETSTRFSDEVIENLPVLGRFYQNLLTLAPGVNDADEDGNPNVHGARSRDFKAVVNGVSNADPLTGEWMSYVNPESIEELEVITAGAGVEFGRAQGGFARVLQKQGSNELEGVVSLIYRSSKLDGGQLSDLETTQDFDWIQPSAQLSGPILRDRLWFRLSHETIDREDPVDLLSSFAVIEQKQGIHADQITWQISPRHKLAFQYQTDPLEIKNFTVSTRIPEESSQTLDRGGDTFSLKWTSPVSARLLTETQVAWQDHSQDLEPTTTGAAQSCVIFTRFRLLNQGRCLDLDANRYSGSHFETVRDNRQRFTLRNDNVLYVPRFLGASHKLKLGFSVENERYFRTLDRRTDMQFAVDPVSGLGQATVTLAVPPENSERTTGNNLAFYFEDQIKPTSGLQVTLGVRVDREEILGRGQEPFDPQAEFNEFLDLDEVGDQNSFARAFTHYADVIGFQRSLADLLGVGINEIQLSQTLASSVSWQKSRRREDVRFANTNVAPRISLAWDPWANGKTKIAVTAGRYYDKLFLGIPLVELEPPSTTLALDARFEQGNYEAFDVNSRFNPTISVQTVDRGLKTPYNDEFTLSIERAILPETTVKATYIRREFRDQLQDIDINHAAADKGYCIVAAQPGAPTVRRSPGAGQIVEDAYRGEIIDTDPGDGDGTLDDCTGDIVRLGGLFGQDQVLPDGLDDLYVLNPGWGEVLLIGNFNETDYEAYVFELVRRLYRNWQMNLSYTWSEAVGNAEDFDQVLGNERNLVEDERGFLSYDQRHIARLHVTTVTPWSVRLGAALRWESGLPYSIFESRTTIFAVPPEFGEGGGTDLDFRLRYPTRQRNDRRNESFWNLDLRIAKEFELGKLANLQITGEVFNVLDDQSLRLNDITNGDVAGERRFGRRWQIGMRVGF